MKNKIAKLPGSNGINSEWKIIYRNGKVPTQQATDRNEKLS